MNRIVYLIRHSKVLKPNNELNSESLQLQNEKCILSVEGENLARGKLVNDELKDLDLIVSSNYVRAMSTAKYLTVNNDLDIKVLSNFGERKFGVNNWDELPKDFGLKQWNDENYKLVNGESRKEVSDRCYLQLMDILSQEYNRIAVVFHAMALLYLLRKWCNIVLKDNNMLEINFKDKKMLISKIDFCQIFKLEFDMNNQLIDINVVN